MSELFNTVHRLTKSNADYSYERLSNGERVIYVYPPVLGQDANGDYINTQGPTQEIYFDRNGERK